MNDDVFQKIDDSNDTFNKIEEESSDNYEDTKEAFVMGLPDWDLEPLYEVVKRSE